MSQNRSIADRQGVIAALRGQGEDDVAALVEATLPPA
jgi:predicted FMN-binding regulatory protein PaiB